MEKQPRYTPDTVQVFPVDMDKLNKAINEHFHKDATIPATTTYRAHGQEALMRQPKLCMIDDEYVGYDVKPADKIAFYVYEQRQLEEHKFSCDAIASWTINLTLADMEQYLKPAVSLAEFTKDANFNKSRIIDNRNKWIQYLNK